MSYRPISGEGQLERFLMWKEKGHGHEKPSILLFLVLPREAISKQRACVFIYLEELNTFMVCAILALMLKRIFYFSSLPTCNFMFQTAVSGIEGWSGRLWIRITDEQNSWIQICEERPLSGVVNSAAEIWLKLLKQTCLDDEHGKCYYCDISYLLAF